MWAAGHRSPRIPGSGCQRDSVPAEDKGTEHPFPFTPTPALAPARCGLRAAAAWAHLQRLGSSSCLEKAVRQSAGSCTGGWRVTELLAQSVALLRALRLARLAPVWGMREGMLSVTEAFPELHSGPAEKHF